MVAEAIVEGVATKDPLLGSEKKSGGMGERRCLVHNRWPHFCGSTSLAHHLLVSCLNWENDLMGPAVLLLPSTCYIVDVITGLEQ